MRGGGLWLINGEFGFLEVSGGFSEFLVLRYWEEEELIGCLAIGIGYSDRKSRFLWNLRQSRRRCLFQRGDICAICS
jgi:hypothetical protein